ncbi:hypothetical protein [Streptomyces sp. NPDC004658]|uniref:hypothetical protein n=1 Tax=Streptomyces sp. NPDC004658 TaxID=3154672 RepID=UPI0033A86B04
MRVETRQRRYFGVRVTIEELFQLAYEVGQLLGQPATAELLIRKESCEVVANSVADIRAALGADVFFGRGRLTVSSSDGSLDLAIGLGEGYGFTYGVLPHRQWWTSHLAIRHREGDVADEMFTKASELLNRRSKGKGDVPLYLTYTQVIFFGILLLLARSMILQPKLNTFCAILVTYVLAWFVLTPILSTRITIRPWPRRRRFRSWTPSPESVSRWTVIAGVLAVPSIVLSVISLLKG